MRDSSLGRIQEPAEEWLMTLRQLSTAEARDELLKFMGVGRKVADCVLLMSLDKVTLYTPSTVMLYQLTPV